MADTLLFQNNAAGTLAFAINTVVTTIALTAGHGGRFPTPAAGQAFRATIQEGANFEIVHVTARSMDTLTVVRAQENTTAKAFGAGASIEARITAGSMGAHAQGPAAIAQNKLLGRSAAGAGPSEEISLDAALQIVAGVLGLTPARLYGIASIGDVKARAAASVPAGWLLCAGQAVSRTTYAALFAEIGTTYGVGDGTTTFNVPDYRGRTLFGRDDMGGAAANRLTVAGSSLSGVTLGAVGGSQFLAQHTHAITDPGHIHTVTDPGHSHTYADPGHVHSVIDPGHVHNLGGGNAIAGPGPGIGNGTSFGFVSTIASPNNTGISLGSGFAGITVNPANVGISIVSQATGITIQNAGTGTSQNIPPAAVVNYFIFAGV